jgi:3-keto-disaccharide hydrolase
MRRLLIAAVAAAATLLPSGAWAQSKKGLPGEDWVSLFNGTDLSGWRKIGNESWTVENELLHGKGLTKDYGYLQTEKPYKDFQLSLRFKCVGDGNSGVFFHTDFKPGTAEVTQGLQFEIDCNMMHHTAGLYGDGRGWIVWPAPENEGVVRMGEWNEYLVEVIGNRYRARLNGVPMVDFTDPNPKSFDGPIALQLHAGGRGNMEFKDIWVRDLSRR